MNRRELFAAGAAGVAGLLVPSMAAARPKYETLREYLLRTLPSQPGVFPFYQFWRINRKVDTTQVPMVWSPANELPHGYIAYCRRGAIESANLNQINEPWCILKDGGWHYVNPQTLELIPYDPHSANTPAI